MTTMPLQGIDSTIRVTARYLTVPTTADVFGDVLAITKEPTSSTDLITRYNNLAEVAIHYASTTEVYEMANRFFSQDPFPPHGLLIARWDDTTYSTPSTFMDAVKAIRPDWYYLVADTTVLDTDIYDSGAATELASWLAADNYNHYFLRSITGANILNANESTSIAAQLWALESYDNIMLGYSKSAQYMDGALAGILSGINFDGIQSIIDPAFKTLSGINVDTFTDAEVMELNRKRTNRYVREGGKNIFRQGWSLQPGIWADSKIWLDWFVYAAQRAAFEVVTGNDIRLPRNLVGLNTIIDAVETVCQQGVTNGGVGPGQLDAPTTAHVRQVTGNQAFNGYLTSGFLVYVDPLSTLTALQEQEREGPPIYVWLKSSGAIHAADIFAFFQN